MTEMVKYILVGYDYATFHTFNGSKYFSAKLFIKYSKREYKLQSEN